MKMNKKELCYYISLEHLNQIHYQQDFQLIKMSQENCSIKPNWRRLTINKISSFSNLQVDFHIQNQNQL